jgi:LSD1 subclass zinc finger protein
MTPLCLNCRTPLTLDPRGASEALFYCASCIERLENEVMRREDRWVPKEVVS